MLTKTYVVYTRVSTDEQGRSGLGLEAQQRDIDYYLKSFGGIAIKGYCDIDSGGNNDRPELKKAMAYATRHGAELLVSKLDRLSRDVEMIAGLMKNRDVSFRVAQMPQADKFQLHIYAALAEQEREMISSRTKAALASSKARGVKLGGLRGDGAHLDRGRQVQAASAHLRATKLGKLIVPMVEEGLSLAAIARRLNDSGIQTVRGGSWDAKAVSRVLERLEVAA